jgi:VTC domain
LGSSGLDLRYEVKSVLPGTEAARVRSWLRIHPAGFVTAYPPRLVNSLYFDSPDRLCFRENLSGIARRRKLRLRWYGADCEIIEPVLELKCKEGLLGWKVSERVSGGPLRFGGSRWGPLMAALRERLSDTSRIRLALAGEPTLLVRYHRDYHVSADGVVRATVDTNIQTVDQSRFGGPRMGPVDPADPEIVLEVKGPESSRREIERTLAEWPLRISRNSKFANGVALALAP